MTRYRATDIIPYCPANGYMCVYTQLIQCWVTWSYDDDTPFMNAIHIWEHQYTSVQIINSEVVNIKFIYLPRGDASLARRQQHQQHIWLHATARRWCGLQWKCWDKPCTYTYTAYTQPTATFNEANVQLLDKHKIIDFSGLSFNEMDAQQPLFKCSTVNKPHRVSHALFRPLSCFIRQLLIAYITYSKCRIP